MFCLRWCTHLVTRALTNWTFYDCKTWKILVSHENQDESREKHESFSQYHKSSHDLYFDTDIKEFKKLHVPLQTGTLGTVRTCIILLHGCVPTAINNHNVIRCASDCFYRSLRESLWQIPVRECLMVPGTVVVWWKKRLNRVIWQFSIVALDNRHHPSLPGFDSLLKHRINLCCESCDRFWNKQMWTNQYQHGALWGSISFEMNNLASERPCVWNDTDIETTIFSKLFLHQRLLCIHKIFFLH